MAPLAIRRRGPLGFAFAAAALLGCLPLAPASADEAPATCGTQSGADSIKKVRFALQEALGSKPAPAMIDSRHLVMIVPADGLASSTGKGVAAHAYAAMPTEVKPGHLPTTTFTKFVVVGHSHVKGPPGISIGDDVCGGAGFADKESVRFFRTEMKNRLKEFAPDVLSCSLVGFCPEKMSAGLDGQLPFLRALRSGSADGQPLRGDLLPVMLQSQDVELSVKVGAALSLLVQPGGVWEGERVLFVFTGDMSSGLPDATALHCDDMTTQVLTRQGVAAAAEYFHTLLSGGADHGCVGAKAAPLGYGPMLAAARVAGDLRLVNRRVSIAHGHSRGLAKGYASLLFWDDSHSMMEQHAIAATGGVLLEEGEQPLRRKGMLRALLRRRRKSQGN